MDSQVALVAPEELVRTLSDQGHLDVLHRVRHAWMDLLLPYHDPLDQLHDQERAAVREDANLVDGWDAWVLELARDAGLAAFCGGSCTETDRSAQVSAHVAMACQAAQVLAKPGMGVDEGLMIVGNEMARTAALVRARGALEIKIALRLCEECKECKR